MAVLDWLINTEVFHHRLGKCLWKCRLIFRLSSHWKGTSKSDNWMQVIHSILEEKMRLDKVRAEVFLCPIGEKWCIFLPSSDGKVQVLSVPQCRCFPFAAVRYRCQDGVPTPPLCYSLHTLAVSGTTSKTACQDALDNDLMQGVKSGEGGFSTAGSCCAICARWEVCTDGEGSSQMCPADN